MTTYPCSVPSCFECASDTATREAACIWFTLRQDHDQKKEGLMVVSEVVNRKPYLDELLARKVHSQCFLVRRSKETDEGVMLFSRQTGKGLEPMCKVGGTLLDGPFFHSSSNLQNAALSMTARKLQISWHATNLISNIGM
jgi:hypothetical protein